jgi:polyisoprenoid-binding protein YceI
VGFAVEYMAGTFTGTFSDFDVSVTNGVLQGSAKVASVQVKDPNLEGHLQSPDFFDAERHPELTFRSISIDRDGRKLKVDGEITIKGVGFVNSMPAQIVNPLSTQRLHGSMSRHAAAWLLAGASEGSASACLCRLNRPWRRPR